MKSFEVMKSILGLLLIDKYEVTFNYLPDFLEYTSTQYIAAKLIELYKTEAKKYYEYGMGSFMTDQNKGDSEKF